MIKDSNHSFDTLNDYLYMTISGKYNFPDFISYIKIIRDKCEEERSYKVLLDILQIEGIDVPTMERFFIGVEEAKQLKYKIKLAVAWHKEYTDRFGEIVALNRGGNVRVFESVEKARNWLMGGNDD